MKQKHDAILVAIVPHFVRIHVVEDNHATSISSCVKLWTFDVARHAGRPNVQALPFRRRKPAAVRRLNLRIEIRRGTLCLGVEGGAWQFPS
jgi:hypothetical protein